MGKTYDSACYCTNLRRAANAAVDFYDAALKESGLTAAQYYLLASLSRLGGANITHWSEHVGLERSTMVRNIQPLLKRGLIEPTEGHGKVFKVSETGASALCAAAGMWDQAQQRMEAFLGEDAQAVLRIGAKLQTLEADG